MKNKRKNNRFYIKVVCSLIAFSCLPILVLWVIQQSLTSQALAGRMFEQRSAELSRFSKQLDALVKRQQTALENALEDVDLLRYLSLEDTDVYKVNYKLQLMFGAEKPNISAYVVPVSSLSPAGTGDIPFYYQPPYQTLNWGIFRKANASNTAILHLNERKSDAGQNVIFSLAQAVRADDETLIGYLIVDIHRSALEQLLPENSQDSGSAIYLFDNWNYVCYASNSPAKEGRNGPPSYIPPRPFTKSEVETKEGLHLGLLYSTNTATGLNMVGEVPLFHSANSMAAIRSSAQLALIICFCISVVAAIMAGNAIASPLRAITKEIKKVKEGDFTTRITVTRKDEFGDLMDAFNEMTSQINHYINVVDEKQKNLRVAEMKNLQAQIQPHFLYNTLDLVKWNIRLGKTERAASIITNLGKLLRAMMNCNDYTTVGEELDLAKRYLAIQTIHYNGNLQTKWDVQPNICSYSIPKLILQPIVENSVQHGLSPSRNDNEITISVRLKGEHLEFTIADNGKGIAPEHIGQILTPSENNGSIGLSNVDARLKLFGDEHCGLFIENRPRGTTVKLVCKSTGLSVNGGGTHDESSYH